MCEIFFFPFCMKYVIFYIEVEYNYIEKVLEKKVIKNLFFPHHKVISCYTIFVANVTSSF